MDQQPEGADKVGAGKDPADVSHDAKAELVEDTKAAIHTAVALTRRLTYDKGLSNRSDIPLMTPSENLLTESQDALELPAMDEEEGAAAPPINENEINV